MHRTKIAALRHPHRFGAVNPQNERRTRWVVLLTLGMMAIEITAGFVTGSMALLADGWHMGTHALALGIALFAYFYARRHADDSRFTFGTGKVGVLGGFASALILAVVAFLMLVESLRRLRAPESIQFDEALLVAVIGLIVNLLSAWLLTDSHSHGADDDHDHGDEHDDEHDHAHGHDKNLRAAYLHVVADALTSVLAIVALLAGRQLGWVWMDPLMGVVGGVVIARWSAGLLRETGRILLDGDVAVETAEGIRRVIEADADNRVADLHVWRVGPSEQAAILSVVTHHPQPPDYYRGLLAVFRDLKHVTVEVHRCDECRPENAEGEMPKEK